MSTPVTPVVICSLCSNKFVDRSTFNDHRRHNGMNVVCVEPENDYVLAWDSEDGVWENYGILRLVETDEILNYYGGGV